jgi:hypothetical protein
LAAVALGATVFCRGYSTPWHNEIVVLVPFFAIMTLVSSQTGFSIHSRYIIPALPFLFIWIGKAARVFEATVWKKAPSVRNRLVSGAVALSFAWSLGSSLFYYPHSLSYFNELVNGPLGGPKHLLNSNIDWGQDLLYLRDWLIAHPDVKLTGLAYWGAYPANLVGIPATPMPPYAAPKEPATANETGPLPGWFAISVNEIYGQSKQFRYFLQFRPVAMAGYSIYIYHISLDDANQLRRAIGLRELPNPVQD